MAGWVEIKPASASDRIAISSRKGGGYTITIGAETAQRNAFAVGPGYRVLVDIAAVPTPLLRLVSDGKGPFRAAALRGGAIRIVLPPLQGFLFLAETTSVEWDECVDEQGHNCIDMDIPVAMRRRESVAHTPAGNSRNAPTKSVSLAKVGGP